MLTCTYLFLSLFQVTMKPGRECPQCGKVLADRFQLYRHTINVHHRRFCWYCPHEEGRPRRLRVHIQRHHPGVPVEEMSNEALWRSGDDEIIPAPASVIVVPRPMELAPDVQRPADGQREVVQEEAIASDVAAEVVSREVERSANGRNTTASQEYWLAVRDRGHLLWQVHWLREWHWQAGSHTIPSDVHDSYS